MAKKLPKGSDEYMTGEGWDDPKLADGIESEGLNFESSTAELFRRLQ